MRERLSEEVISRNCEGGEEGWESCTATAVWETEFQHLQFLQLCSDKLDLSKLETTAEGPSLPSFVFGQSSPNVLTFHKWSLICGGCSSKASFQLKDLQCVK